MGLYFKGYARRLIGISLAIGCFLAAMALSGILFYDKLNKISSQLESYAQSDYDLIYVLNYSSGLSNECIFTDTDTQIYLDESGLKRLTVSSIMKDADSSYDLDYLETLNDLSPQEMVISRNVSEKYNLGIGSKVFVDFPCSGVLQEFIITGITREDYDYTRPSIDNDIGVVALGYDEEYEKEVQCKYALFSEHSASDVLSGFPQIIDSVIKKSDNIKSVVEQGRHILVFQALFCAAALLVGHISFFSKSKKLLRRCYLKGMKRNWLVVVPLVERVLFGVIPGLLVTLAFFAIISAHSQMRTMFALLPSLIWFLYCLVMFCVDIGTNRKGRRLKWSY